MNITCSKCDGSGDIVCCTCDHARECSRCYGDGVVSESIEHFLITRDLPAWEEFTALKEDAVRARKDAQRLEVLVPERAEAYRSQLKAVLVEIDAQASALEKWCTTLFRGPGGCGSRARRRS